MSEDDAPLLLSIVIPFRSKRHGALNVLMARWAPLARCGIEVIICDGSPGSVFGDAGASAWRAIRHLPVDRSRYFYANDKVNGLCTGVMAACAEAVLICDDDCQLTSDDLDKMIGIRLEHQAVKIPTLPASFTVGESLEAVRSLISYGVSRHGEPSPVCLASRHSLLASLGNGVGNVLFDDYMLERELRRTLVVVTHSRVSPVRDAPLSAKWGEQQVRYAYEDLSAVGKTLWFLTLPWLAAFLGLRGYGDLVTALALLAIASCAAAALGLRRHPFASCYPLWIIGLAPLWGAIRTCAVPLALGFLLTGGYPYGGRRIWRPACLRIWDW